MKKFFFTATLTALIAACTPVTMPETASPVVPAPGAVKTIGYDAYNAPATAYLKEMLGQTAKVMVSIDAKELPLTSAETAGLLALLWRRSLANSRSSSRISHVRPGTSVTL